MGSGPPIVKCRQGPYLGEYTGLKQAANRNNRSGHGQCSWSERGRKCRKTSCNLIPRCSVPSRVCVRTLPPVRGARNLTHCAVRTLAAGTVCTSPLSQRPRFLCCRLPLPHLPLPRVRVLHTLSVRAVMLEEQRCFQPVVDSKRLQGVAWLSHQWAKQGPVNASAHQLWEAQVPPELNRSMQFILDGLLQRLPPDTTCSALGKLCVIKSFAGALSYLSGFIAPMVRKTVTLWHGPTGPQ